jgi:hypothetical protein
MLCLLIKSVRFGNIKAHIAFNDMKASVDQMMDDRLNDMHKKVNLIYKKVVKA